MHTGIIKAGIFATVAAAALQGATVFSQQPTEALQPVPAGQTEPMIPEEPAAAPTADRVLIPPTQQPTQPVTSVPSVPLYRPYREVSVPTATERLIHERAMYRARQRQARLESLKWLGISTQRPMFSNDAFCTDLNATPYFANGYFHPQAGNWTRSPWAR